MVIKQEPFSTPGKLKKITIRVLVLKKYASETRFERIFSVEAVFPGSSFDQHKTYIYEKNVASSLPRLLKMAGVNDQNGDFLIILKVFIKYR